MKQLVSAQAKRAAGAAVLLFGLAVFFLLRFNEDAVELALWITSPQLVPLAVFLLTRTHSIALAAAIVLALLWTAAAGSWVSGGLGALFLPLLAYALYAIVAAALWLISAIYVSVAEAAGLMRRRAP